MMNYEKSYDTNNNILVVNYRIEKKREKEAI